MIITVQCPSCETSFPVDTGKVPEGGVSARCSVCATVFRVEKPAPPEEAESTPPGETLEPASGAWTAPAAEDLEVAGGAEVAVGEAETPEEPSEATVEAEAPETTPAAAVEESTEPPFTEPTEPAVTEPPEATVAEPTETALAEPPETTAEEPAPERDREAPGEPVSPWAVPSREEPVEAEAGPPETLDTERGEAGPSEAGAPQSHGPEPEDAGDALDLGWDVDTTVSVEGEGEEPPTSDAVEVEPLEVERTGEQWAVEAELEEVGQGAAEAEEAGEGGTEAELEEAGEGGAEEGAPEEEEAQAQGAGPEAHQGEVPETIPAPAEPPAAFQFGKRDPHEKAQRLARVLVSDMIMYNPERHGRALDGGTLREDFEDEIRKSWDEYVDQVGDDVARSTTYFSDALNDILARGERVFEGNPPL